jgi:1,4-dihydroxy-2-naphthoyl-CoA synthase
MLLLGKPISAADAYSRFNMLVLEGSLQPLTDIAPSVNAVVLHNKLMSTALEWAATIVSNSPDAVRSTKKALLLAKESGMWESSKQHFASPHHKVSMTGENIKVRNRL